LVIDNKSQHSDVEIKKRERERENERKIEQQSTIQKQEERKKHECHHSVFIVLNYDNLT
jgi:hypothetical protein